jgi:hypothetical protein
MAIKITPGLAKYLLVTGCAQDALANGFIHFYAGPVPATAGAAPSGTPLWSISISGDGVTGITWGATDAVLTSTEAVAMQKNPAEVWSGQTTAGTVTHFRIVGSADGADADDNDPRIQGSVSMVPGSDFVMSNTTLTTNTSPTAKVISDFTVGLPLG